MYLSLDVGTTVVKAVLFSRAGRECLVAARACQTTRSPGGAAEQNPAELAEAVWEVLGEILQNAGGEKVEAICLSTQGGSFLPLGENGQPVHPVITWMDERADGIVEAWKAEGKDRWIREKSGWWPEAGLPLATLEWFRQNEPEAFAKTAHVCSVNDYLGFLLTGQYATNPSCAGEMLLMNPVTRQWQPELLAMAGLRREQCSPILDAAAQVGVLTDAAMQRLGLQETLPVFCGGQDHTLEALAFGITGSGQALLACGTAWVINTAAGQDELPKTPAALGMNPHVLPGRWILSQYLGCFGAVYEWWVQNLWQAPGAPLSREALYNALNEKLAAAPAPAKELFFFPPSGGRQLGGVRGTGGFFGGNLSQTREDWTLALMEGILQEVRWALETLENSGLPLHELWMIGGAAKSSVWPQMAADLLGLPVFVSGYSHGPALGAAMISAAALGHCPSLEECRRAFPVQKKVFRPQPLAQQIRGEKFARYKQLSALLAQPPW